jgi:hypothetical protein
MYIFTTIWSLAASRVLVVSDELLSLLTLASPLHLLNCRPSMRLPDGSLSPVVFKSPKMSPYGFVPDAVARGLPPLPSPDAPATLKLVYQKAISAERRPRRGQLLSNQDRSFLCLFDPFSQQVVGLELKCRGQGSSSPTCGEAFLLAATAMTPVELGRPFDGIGNGMVVREPSGHLALYAGLQRICYLSLPPLPLGEAYRALIGHLPSTLEKGVDPTATGEPCMERPMMFVTQTCVVNTVLLCSVMFADQPMNSISESENVMAEDASSFDAATEEMSGIDGIVEQIAARSVQVGQESCVHASNCTYFCQCWHLLKRVVS